MAAGYFAAGKHQEIGTFELSIRRLPRNRDFVLTAGLHRALDYLAGLRFEKDEIAYLRGLPNFRHAQPGFWTICGLPLHRDVFAIRKVPCSMKVSP